MFITLWLCTFDILDLFDQDALINAMNDELPRIQEQVYYGHISSHTNVLEKFLSESGIQRYNPQVNHLE